MELEPITRQEQIIAGKDLEPITRMERFLKEYGGGSGSSVQSDWNQTDETAADFIRNKPFGEMYEDTLTVEQIDVNTIDPSTLVSEALLKVNDAVVTMDDLSNGFGIGAMGQYAELPPEEIGEVCEQLVDGVVVIAGLFFSVDEQAVGVALDGLVFPESGTYIVIERAMEADVSLTIPGFGKFETTKKIEEKYLPGVVILYTDGTYLYSSADTSDTTNRMTKAELKSVAQSCRTVYLYDYIDGAGVDIFAQIQIYMFLDEYGVAQAYDGDIYSFYTAEYVPTT